MTILNRVRAAIRAFRGHSNEFDSIEIKKIHVKHGDILLLYPDESMGHHNLVNLRSYMFKSLEGVVKDIWVIPPGMDIGILSTASNGLERAKDKLEQFNGCDAKI